MKYKSHTSLHLVAIFFVVFITGCSIAPIDTSLNYSTRGEHQQAINIFEKEVGEIDNWKKVGKDGGIPGTGYFYMFMGTTICKSYLELRRYDKANECLESWIEEAVKERGKETFQTRYYGYKSRIALEFGDYKKAYEYGEKALLKPDELGNSSDYFNVLANAAIAANQLGKRDRAYQFMDAMAGDKRSVFSSGNTIFSSGGNEKGKNAIQARAYMALGDYKKAGEALQQSTFGAWNALGYTFRGLMAVASLGVSELLDGGVSRMGKDSLSVDFIIMKSKLCFELNDYSCAKAGYDALITNKHDTSNNIADNIGDNLLSQRPGSLYMVLYDRGTIARNEGDQSLGFKYYSQAIDVIEAQRSTINTEASKIGFVGNKEDVYRDTVALLVEMQRFDDAFVYAERAKARALVDTLASKQSLGANENNQTTAQLVSGIHQAETQLASSSYAGKGRQRAVDRALLRKKQKTLIDVQPELASLVTVSAPDLSELQALMPANETILEYYGDSENLYAFVLNKKGVGAVKLNADGLSDEVSAFREALSNPKDGSYHQMGKKLYSRLIAPVASRIKTNAVTIVPHGALHYLPFSALESNGRFMIDRYAMRVLPSASVMKFLKTHSSAPNDLLALGNPDVGDSSLDLPGAQLEAQSVVKGFSRAKLLLRKQATETAVKNIGGNFKRLHFASHGVFDAEKPLASGLMLASDSSNDGILTVGELYDLKLNADLVTLSACETALGKVANGDDVVGFTRGFLYAGASSIVSSLWKVDDSATNYLMQSFYTNLKKQNKRSALRTAKLNVKKQYQHPYYWAAFQLTGAVN